ncbi:hypothetical protein GGH94_004892 [Coemansia aciculifera]|uniref:Uncharacterized protein n=1 Tax=Coemansia aciculifera TaxID=417176 RepID=A0A9W8IEK3_9FUNG|nr:hypothetical protein GGH94_004892 [Coemansia aciculifera]
MLCTVTVTGPQHKSTPGHEFLPNEANENELELDDRRDLLTAKLEGLGTPLEFLELLDELDLESAYKDYKDATGDMFDNIASDAPTIGSAPLSELSGNGAIAPVKTYVQRFMNVVRLMCGRATKVEALPKQYARTPYDNLSRLDSYIDGEPFSQPDVAFVFNGQGEVSFSDVYIALKAEEYANEPDAYCQHIGQLADYALALWKRQPTRTFVPVLFLHGHQLDLLVFYPQRVLLDRYWTRPAYGSL